MTEAQTQAHAAAGTWLAGQLVCLPPCGGAQMVPPGLSPCTVRCSMQWCLNVLTAAHTWQGTQNTRLPRYGCLGRQHAGRLQPNTFCQTPPWPLTAAAARTCIDAAARATCRLQNWLIAVHSELHSQRWSYSKHAQVKGLVAPPGMHYLAVRARSKCAECCNSWSLACRPLHQVTI